MKKRKTPYPIVDIFAGPGGLGEGFSSFIDENDTPRFHSIASIERDEHAHSTLKLRHFLRKFSGEEIPEDYYSFLAGQISLEELYENHKPQAKHADKTALRISLGPDNHAKVQNLISKRLGRSKKWALVGGPPCQAYSLVGRSRMMGNPEFEKDERHFLYREYLKIIRDHQPPVFVMENVKGLLSAKVSGEKVIDKIVADLSAPDQALDKTSSGLGYRLYSLADDEAIERNVDARQFLVKSENYGVPQARHRMFIVGIRNDINVKPSKLKTTKAPTVKDMIGMLPKVRSGISKQKDNWENWVSALREFGGASTYNSQKFEKTNKHIKKVVNELLCGEEDLLDRTSTTYPQAKKSKFSLISDLHDTRLKQLSDHTSRAHMASDLRRYMFASSFAHVEKRTPKIADFPQDLYPKHSNIEQAVAGEMFSDRFRVQLSNSHATTITSHISKDGHYFIHYDPMQCRSLTVREAARLQTFPDNYKFLGPRTAQFHQVGNAVPPALAKKIAKIISEILDKML